MYYYNMDKILNNFSKNLKLKLKEENLTQRQFAKLINVSATCVSKWILCQREPTLNNIIKILKLFALTFDDLIN